MPDAQDALGYEPAWDLRALEAVDSVSDAASEAAGVTGPLAALYPSLLGDDPYGSMVEAGLEALAERLAA